MSISPGTRFGPYEVAGEIGAGGMGVICREERYLARKFGQPYLAYKERVRRWC